MTRTIGLFAFVGLQALFTLVFLWDLLSSLLGLRLAPMSWQMREMLEIGAALGLVLGLVFGTLIFLRVERKTARMEDQLRAASGAFMELLEEKFEQWGLTKAERDVALFSIKGFSTAEIAAFRDTSEGTVKAQTNAIYRKAGVSGRPQLLSLFIENLMDGPMMERPETR